MPNEAWSYNPTPPHKSLEELKQAFKQRLDAILYKQLTIDNIETFADEALAETIKLDKDIVKEYERNPNVPTNGPHTFSPIELENKAFSTFDLADINEILNRINTVKGSIDSLKTYLQTNAEKVDTIITPPLENSSANIVPGNGTFERKKTSPRLLTLMYILEHDFDITPTPETVLVKEGVITPEMMRKTPYTRIEIPNLNRVAYICDEEGNTTYVFDTTKLKEVGLTLEEIDVDDKRDKNSLIAYYPGIGVRIIQTKNWRDRMLRMLGEPIPEVVSNLPEQHEEEDRERVSEFREKKKWMLFKDFQAEVKPLYPGKGNKRKWYREEQVKHAATWPAAPEDTYKGRGWKSWPEFFGEQKKEFLSFEDFKTEVKSWYDSITDRKTEVARLYKKEKKQRPNWPTHPDETYKGKGWEGWEELVEKYLPFDRFQKEVMSLCPKDVRNVHEWYLTELPKHSNWYSNPNQNYRGKGWVDWPTLVGRISVRGRKK